MPQYLIAIQHPNNYDPSLEGEAMIRDIGALNEETDAAGVRLFAGGLESASHAKYCPMRGSLQSNTTGSLRDGADHYEGRSGAREGKGVLQRVRG